MGFFDTPDVEYIETPPEEETEQDQIERIKKERAAQEAFFGSLREGGAEELRKPTTGLNF